MSDAKVMLESKVKWGGHEWTVNDIQDYDHRAGGVPKTLTLRRVEVVDPKKRFKDEPILKRNVPAKDVEVIWSPRLAWSHPSGERTQDGNIVVITTPDRKGYEVYEVDRTGLEMYYATIPFGQDDRIKDTKIRWAVQKHIKKFNHSLHRASSLRAATIRLAHAKPELRPVLLPLLKEAIMAPKPRSPEEKREVVRKGKEFFDEVEKLLSGKGEVERSGSMLTFQVGSGRNRKWSVADLDYNTFKVVVRNHHDQKKKAPSDPRKVSDLLVEMTEYQVPKEAAAGSLESVYWALADLITILPQGVERYYSGRYGDLGDSFELKIISSLGVFDLKVSSKGNGFEVRVSPKQGSPETVSGANPKEVVEKVKKLLYRMGGEKTAAAASLGEDLLKDLLKSSLKNKLLRTMAGKDLDSVAEELSSLSDLFSVSVAHRVLSRRMVALEPEFQITEDKDISRVEDTKTGLRVTFDVWGPPNEVDPNNMDWEANLDPRRVEGLVTKALGQPVDFLKGMRKLSYDSVFLVYRFSVSIPITLNDVKQALVRYAPEIIGRTAAGKTYAEAKAAVMDYLKSKGWKLSAPGLKVPHATSPDGKIRFWFKTQAVYFTNGNQHNLNGARTVSYDTDEIKKKTPQQYVEDAEAFARKED